MPCDVPFDDGSLLKKLLELLSSGMQRFGTKEMSLLIVLAKQLVDAFAPLNSLGADSMWDNIVDALRKLKAAIDLADAAARIVEAVVNLVEQLLTSVGKWTATKITECLKAFEVLQKCANAAFSFISEVAAEMWSTFKDFHGPQLAAVAALALSIGCAHNARSMCHDADKDSLEEVKEMAVRIDYAINQANSILWSDQALTAFGVKNILFLAKGVEMHSQILINKLTAKVSEAKNKHKNTAVGGGMFLGIAILVSPAVALVDFAHQGLVAAGFATASVVMFYASHKYGVAFTAFKEREMEAKINHRRLTATIERLEVAEAMHAS